MEIRTHDEGRYHRREMLIDGEVVAWLSVIDYQMRIGSARVRMAGIGGVETHHNHRMKGLMRILFEDTVRYMTSAGYDVSLLFGIPNFYTKFGYATCLPACQVMIATRNAELAQADAPACRARPMQPDDLPFIIELYERQNAGRSCSVARTAEHFTHFPKGTHWGQPAEAVVFEDQAGRRMGYAAWDKTNERVSVVEAEADEDRYFGALLTEFARQAVAKRCGHITLHLPPDHPFADYLQRFGCEWTITCPRHADGMMRLINQAALFSKLQPELERRVRAAHLPTPLDVSIITELGALRLREIGDRLALEDNTDAPASITLSQDKLAQLMAGYRPARDVLNDAGAQATGNVLPQLDALFPRGWPHLWHADHF